MENFKRIREEIAAFNEEVEKFDKRETKASASRLRKIINNIGNLKIEAKRDLMKVGK